MYSRYCRNDDFCRTSKSTNQFLLEMAFFVGFFENCCISLYCSVKFSRYIQKMGRPKGSKNLTRSDREVIAQGRAMGMTLADLSTKQYKTNVSTICASAKKPKRSKPTGRPRRTTAAIDRVIARISKADPRKNSADINKGLMEHHGVQVIFFVPKVGENFFRASFLACRCPTTRWSVDFVLWDSTAGGP